MAPRFPNQAPRESRRLWIWLRSFIRAGSLSRTVFKALDSMMQDLPQITEQLKRIDVDALNTVLDKLPALMNDLSQIQSRLDSLGAWFGNLGAMFQS